MRPSIPLVRGFIGFPKLIFLLTGATHEMMRADRDSYVKILLENLEPGNERSFLKKETDLYSTRETPFDFDSIMFYGPTDYGILDSAGQRMTTIQPLMAGVDIRYIDDDVARWVNSKFRFLASSTVHSPRMYI